MTKRRAQKEKWFKSLNYIIQHKPIGIFISGGEPLLLYPLWAKQIEKFERAGIIDMAAHAAALPPVPLMNPKQDRFLESCVPWH